MDPTHKTRLEAELDMLLPPQFDSYDPTTQANMVTYLRQLDKTDKKAHKIGVIHLGSSYDILRSNGYIKWLQTKK